MLKDTVLEKGHENLMLRDSHGHRISCARREEPQLGVTPPEGSWAITARTLFCRIIYKAKSLSARTSSFGSEPRAHKYRILIFG